jgi:hypothetical protein
MSVVLLLSVTGSAFAAMPVIDVITNANTGVTAIQTTISAVQAVLQTAHWVIEQTPFDEAIGSGELAVDTAEIVALVQDAQALGFEITALAAQVQSLFGLAGAPRTTTEFAVRMAEIRGAVYQTRSYAVRAQSLVTSVIRTVNLILRVYDRMQSILGNLSGQQQLSEQLTQLVTLQTKQNIAEMASQLAENVDRLQEPLILESLDRINKATMATHPR